MRRLVVVVALGAGLVGCAPTPVVYVPALTPAQQAANDARQLGPISAEDMAASIQRRQTVDVICNARAQVAAAQPNYGGPGLSGAIVQGITQGQYGNTVLAACLQVYEVTGILPTY